jgi:hypothetical protein
MYIQPHFKKLHLPSFYSWLFLCCRWSLLILGWTQFYKIFTEYFSLVSYLTLFLFSQEKDSLVVREYDGGIYLFIRSMERTWRPTLTLMIMIMITFSFYIQLRFSFLYDIAYHVTLPKILFTSAWTISLNVPSSVLASIRKAHFESRGSFTCWNFGQCCHKSYSYN